MGVLKKTKRAPSALLAKKRMSDRMNRRKASAAAAEVEARNRKCGGFGVRTVSIWAAPKGGIKSSPAYLKVTQRCGGTMPPPQDRAGACIRGGFPYNKYPPNVLVDGRRDYWVPDDWAQAVKNTGPGGTYIGWMSPEGKFFYHKSGYPSAIEAHLGRQLGAFDGYNGILRQIRTQVKVDADKTFLKECLTPAERRHIASKDEFHFGIVSARRATGDAAHACMVVEAHCQLAGVKPTWYVDAESLDAYKKLGLIAKVGGKLTPARNMILDDAEKKGLVGVEVSDDISQWCFYDVEKQNFSGEKDFKKQNAALLGARCHVITPLAAAQYLLAKMRSSPLKPQLGGVYPTANAAMVLGQVEFNTEHFILGDFFVADTGSKIRFDTTMTLKEDYDYTCQHISKHGSVLRCNRMFVHARHSTNAGGAVSSRDSAGKKERENIAILQKKWPGVFRVNIKRKDEVVLSWKMHGKDPSESSSTGKTTSSRISKAQGARGARSNVQSIPSSRHKSSHIEQRCKHGKAIKAVKTSTKKSGEDRRYKVVGLPHIGLALNLGSSYTAADLLARCRGNADTVLKLQNRLRDPATFRLIR